MCVLSLVNILIHIFVYVIALMSTTFLVIFDNYIRCRHTMVIKLCVFACIFAGKRLSKQVYRQQTFVSNDDTIAADRRPGYVPPKSSTDKRSCC